MLEVSDKLLMSHLCLTLSNLELMYAFDVLVDLVVSVVASNNFCRLEQKPEVEEVEVDHYENDDRVVNPHAVESACVCKKA